MQILDFMLYKQKFYFLPGPCINTFCVYPVVLQSANF